MWWSISIGGLGALAFIGIFLAVRSNRKTAKRLAALEVENEGLKKALEIAHAQLKAANLSRDPRSVVDSLRDAGSEF